MIYYIADTQDKAEAYEAYVKVQIGLETPYGWSDIINRAGAFYIRKHPVHTSDTLQEAELPAPEDIDGI